MATIIFPPSSSLTPAPSPGARSGKWTRPEGSMGLAWSGQKMWSSSVSERADMPYVYKAANHNRKKTSIQNTLFIYK